MTGIAIGSGEHLASIFIIAPTFESRAEKWLEVCHGPVFDKLKVAIAGERVFGDRFRV